MLSLSPSPCTTGDLLRNLVEGISSHQMGIGQASLKSTGQVMRKVDVHRHRRKLLTTGGISSLRKASALLLKPFDMLN
jgi:hypothetical protein